MFKKWIHFFQRENGDALILFAVLMTVFIALAGLVIDVGLAFANKEKIQQAADAAALASVMELPGFPDKAKQVASSIAQANHVQPSEFSVGVDSSNQIVTTAVTRAHHLYFGNAIGVADPILHVKAVAELGTLTSAKGVIPLGIDSSTNLSFGEEVTIKQGESTVGNFGALVTSGTGANNFETDLQYGTQNVIHIGDILDTQTGDMVGPTQTAMQARLSACPYQGTATYTNFPDNCPLICYIPVYIPYDDDQNQLKKVQVVGFAVFFLEGVGAKNDGSPITGRFIQYATSGDLSFSQPNYGAYAYKLIQ
jgi:hypothetical protein